jgi:hypothetical protein
LALTCVLLAAAGAPLTMAAEGWKGLWTDRHDESLPVEFQIQGEYVGRIENGPSLGCQVICLGPAAFQAVMLPGGLPGAGWDGQHKILMDGRMDGAVTVFEPATGNKQYLAKEPERFSATRPFPPRGQAPWSARVEDGVMQGKTDAGKRFTLKKTERKSPTEGAAAPKNATVLFDGSTADHFRGGRLDEETRLLNTDGRDIRTKEKFDDYVIHIEFLLPFRPDARGQGRGNSGMYQVDHYEVQILDSFGLEGLNNECGGVYKIADPLVNMCFPPLTWQTYDIEFTNAERDESGKKTKNAVMTVKHNGVVIHQDLELKGRTGGHRNEPEATPGPIKLQGHGNPLQFRNIWIVP